LKKYIYIYVWNILFFLLFEFLNFRKISISFARNQIKVIYINYNTYKYLHFCSWRIHVPIWRIEPVLVFHDFTGYPCKTIFRWKQIKRTFSVKRSNGTLICVNDTSLLVHTSSFMIAINQGVKKNKRRKNT